MAADVSAVHWNSVQKVLVALPSPPDAQMPLGYAKVEASELERPFHVHYGGGGSLWFLRA